MAVLGHNKSETIFLKISLPVWVSNVTFLALSRGWKGFFDFTSWTRIWKTIALVYSALWLANTSNLLATIKVFPSQLLSFRPGLEERETYQMPIDFWIKTNRVSSIQAFLQEQYTGRIDQKWQTTTSMWLIQLYQNRTNRAQLFEGRLGFNPSFFFLVFKSVF